MSLGSTIACELCGKEIIKFSGQQRFCPECAKKHLAEVDHKQSIAWKRNNPEKYKKIKSEFSRRRYISSESKSSGVTGVTWDKTLQKWRVTINHKGKQYYILKTKNLTLAIQARKEAERIKFDGINSIMALRIKYKNLNILS